MCCKLNVEHVKRQPRRLQAIREKRGGNTVDLHLGDLDVWVENREVIEERKRRAKRIARTEEETRTAKAEAEEKKKRAGGKKRYVADEDGSWKKCRGG